ncbi:MAG: ABC transporter ATP-binding protein [Candidatus Rokubacteria bacterium]|nr:ABC transporter ATP-binding protein [Candidatus Rokubacteria bacterium]
MLTVRELNVAYGRVRVLAGVSLRVDPGELVTLVGPNGAGKTTLLRAITGLVPAHGGAIDLEGTALHGRPPEAIAALGVAMVPEGRELFGDLSVRDNLRLGAYRLPRAVRRAGLADDLERVLVLFPALRPRLAQPAGTLSGGEQQMVAIGRALMARPRALLLDEPSVGLAPLVIREIFGVIASLKAAGLAMLLVEQNARAAFRIADRGYVLRPGGRLAEACERRIDSAAEAYGLEREPAPVASSR